MKILPEMYPWTRKLPLNYGSHPILDTDLGIFELILPLWDNGNLLIFADSSRRCRRILMKFSGGNTKSHTHQANFGADPDHDLDRGIFNRITTTRAGPVYEFCVIRHLRLKKLVLSSSDS